MARQRQGRLAPSRPAAESVEMSSDAYQALIETRRRGSRATDELIRLALEERDEDRRWELVFTLQARETKDALDRALRLCEARSAKERALGADILAQSSLPHPDARSRDQRCEALILLLGDERVTVIESAAFGLGHLGEARGIGPLVELAGHPSARVRYAVVFGLLRHRDSRAIEALIQLSNDSVAHVRDWATFGLGSQLEGLDTPEIREALHARLGDDHHDTRGEAMVGLALRKDSRVVETLLQELASDCVSALAIEAARVLGDTRLCDALLSLREWWPADTHELDEAIVCCTPVTHAA
jgi:HEAT repeat protein